MFHHVKELQFNARVSKPDVRFAKLLLEQFGGPNGELKAAMQYFVHAFGCRKAYPAEYDMLMDIATEEFSHLEIVGATVQMLLTGVNGELKNAADDVLVLESLRFLMTIEVVHFQMFQAALDSIQLSFPPGILQSDPRLATNISIFCHLPVAGA